MDMRTTFIYLERQNLVRAEKSLLCTLIFH